MAGAPSRKVALEPSATPPVSVFVVGTLFSGSTLIGRDMTTHLQGVHYVGELLNFTDFPGLSHEASGLGCVPCRVLRSGTPCAHFSPERRASVSYEDILGMHNEFASSLDTWTRPPAPTSNA